MDSACSSTIECCCTTREVYIISFSAKNADKAFVYACDLAKKAGASLLILHVSEELGTLFNITLKILIRSFLFHLFFFKGIDEEESKWILEM
jgi:hypothetical protein